MATLTKDDFRARVIAYARAQGQPFISLSDYAALDEFIGEQVKRASSEFKLIYDDKVTFTLTASQPLYSLRDTAVFGKELLEIDAVMIDGNYLQNYDGVSGLVSINELSYHASDYLTASAETPNKAAMVSNHTLRLSPKPDSTYTSYVSGWIVHPEYTELASNAEMSFLVEDCNSVARLVAGELILPNAEGPTLQKALTLIDRGRAELGKAETKASRQFDGPMVRGRKVTHTYQLT